MKKKIFKIIMVVLAVIMGISPVTAFAQVREADSFSIDEVMVYRNCLELLDQLYIVKYDMQYTTVPDRPITETYLLRLRNGVIELATTQPYAFFNSGYDTGYISVYFPSITAPAWSGNYTMDLMGNPTLQWMDSTAVTQMQGAVADNATAITDETTEANSAVANDMNLMGWAPQIDDAYYFGSTGMFDILTLNIGTPGDWTGLGVWEYWDGTIWRQPDNVVDGTGNFTSAAGLHNVTFDAPESWQSSLVNGTLAYWIRHRITAYTGIVTRPLGTQSWVNTIAPPLVSTSVFTSWYDGGSIVNTANQMTIYLRAAAEELETIWGGTTNLVDTIAGVPRFSADGETYFTNVIAGLRDMAPELFADVLANPEFPERYLGGSFYIGGDNADNATYGNNWFAQTFTTNLTESINGLWFKGYRVGNPGTLTWAVRATAGSVPTGADLVAGTFNGNNLTNDADGDWYQVSFSEDEVLAAGTEYALVVRAAAGGAANYFAWRKNDAGTYAGGQAAYSINAGVAWTANATDDFIFQTTIREGWSASLRNRLAARLIGTRFDMTALGAKFGFSRMWMSGIIWMIMTVLVAWGATRGSKSYKLSPMIMGFMFIFGAMAGFMYLEVATTFALLSFAGGVYVLFYRGAG